MSDALDDQRGSEVDDYSGQIPRVEHHTAAAIPAGQQPSGFGDGDVADIDDDEFAPPAETRPAGDAGDSGESGESGEPAEAADEGDGPVDLDALIAERDQYKDVAMRLQADFENFRKRISSQGADDVDRATGRLAEAFLPVLDAAEAAYLRHPDEVGPLLSVMLAELKKHGLETLNLESQPFDPEVAEAVAHEPGGGGDVVVSEVMRSGYRWRGKTLRAAMVRTRD